MDEKTLGQVAYEQSIENGRGMVAAPEFKTDFGREVWERAMATSWWELGDAARQHWELIGEAVAAAVRGS